MKNFLKASSVIFGVFTLSALPVNAQITSGDVRVFTEVAPGLLDDDDGAVIDSLNGVGNVELGRTNAGLDGLQGSLSLNLDGGVLTLRSLTQADWDGGLADEWFDQAFDTFGTSLQPLLTLTGITQDELQTIVFDNFDADAILSDPNIESVTELANGDIDIDLAGRLDLAPLVDAVASSFGIIGASSNLPDFSASDVVAYDYRGNSGFLFSIGEAGSLSGVAEINNADVFAVNYTVHLDGTAPTPTTSVPEPFGLLGLVVASGIAVLNQHKCHSTV